MDKTKEIEILQNLKGDTYFNQFFSNEDIDQMCLNIKNDFGIECGCQFNRKAEALAKEKENALRAAKVSEENFVRELINNFRGDIPEEIQGQLYRVFGHLFVINHKRQKGFKLTENEIDWLIAFANENKR